MNKKQEAFHAINEIIKDKQLSNGECMQVLVAVNVALMAAGALENYPTNPAAFIELGMERVMELYAEGIDESLRVIGGN